jgi:hypothetical protein
MKLIVASFIILALAGCKSGSNGEITPDGKTSIEVIRKFQINKPIEVKLSSTNLAPPDLDQLDVFLTESGHHPSVYWIRAKGPDQLLIDGCYVTKNQEESSLLSLKDHKTEISIFFIPEKEIKITPGNPVTYVTGRIIRNH